MGFVYGVERLDLGARVQEDLEPTRFSDDLRGAPFADRSLNLIDYVILLRVEVEQRLKVVTMSFFK